MLNSRIFWSSSYFLYLPARILNQKKNPNNSPFNRCSHKQIPLVIKLYELQALSMASFIKEFLVFTKINAETPFIWILFLFYAILVYFYWVNDQILLNILCDFAEPMRILGGRNNPLHFLQLEIISEYLLLCHDVKFSLLHSQFQYLFLKKKLPLWLLLHIISDDGLCVRSFWILTAPDKKE